MTEFPGFVGKSEVEGVNASETQALREAFFLVVGIAGGGLALFVLISVVVEFAAPLMPPGLEYRLFGGWVSQVTQPVDAGERMMNDRADRVLQHLLQSWPTAPYPIHVSIEISDQINAFAVPGGSILVTSELMENVQDDRELAFVIGHELGHFAHRDHLRGMGRGVAVAMISGVLGAHGVGSPALRLIEHFDQVASRSMDRQQEISADAFGRDLLVAVFGDSKGSAAFLTRLEEEGSGSETWLGYMHTHPGAQERLAALAPLEVPNGNR